MNKHHSAFERMCERETLLAAWKAVRSGRVAAGVDQVTLAEYARDLEANLAALAARVREGRYYPLPVRQIEIRKAGGGTRQLGIYSLDDSVLQRAAKDVLEPLFEPSFLDCSFGFRPGRNVAMAVKRVLDCRAAGDKYVVDADIADCFGSLDHDLIMRLFGARVRDKRMQALVRLWLDTGMALPKAGENVEGGLYERVTEWLSGSVDGAVSHLLSDRFGGYGYGYPAMDAYGAGAADEERSADEVRKEARREALKRAGGAGLMWALTYAGRARKFMSPTSLALAGAAVLAAAAAPTAARAVRRCLNPDADRLFGVVQGGAISPLLSNVCLHEFDAAMTRAGLPLVRYADDFVICCRDEAAAQRAMELAAQKLAELRLRLHPQKTRVVRFDEAPLEFLGYRFAQFENTATPISPADTSPVVTALRVAREQLPAKLAGARDKAAPVVSQMKDKAARLSALVSRRCKGSVE
jgi:RNA-directed DNA polymerase